MVDLSASQVHPALRRYHRACRQSLLESSRSWCERHWQEPHPSLLRPFQDLLERWKKVKRRLSPLLRRSSGVESIMEFGESGSGTFLEHRASLYELQVYLHLDCFLPCAFRVLSVFRVFEI